MSAFARIGPGTVFGGDFRLVAPLSEGGMGAVWTSEQLSTGKERALKLMHPQLLVDERQRQRFAQEARVGAKIDSDHVVEVVAAGVDGATGMPWLAMELLKGETLAQMIARSGGLDLPTAREVFGQLGHALCAAHDAGIVHRDLKPENVFLSVPRRMGVPFTLKVLDFGIAKLVAESHTRQTASLGTPLWMAPEQTETGAPIRPACDVWALGLIAFAALTGRSYWQAANLEGGGSAMQLLREVILDPLDPASVRAAALGAPGRIPPGFDGWFARCVARDAGARFADARGAHAALESMVFAALGPAGAAIAAVHSTSAPSPLGVAATAPMTTQSAAAIARARVEPGAPGGSPIDGDDETDAGEATSPVRRSSAPWVVLGVVGVVGVVGLFVFLGSGTPDAPPPSVDGHHAAGPEALGSARSKPSLDDEPRVPSVRIEPLQDAVHLPDANAVLEHERWRMLACYKQALVDAPNLAGTVTVALKVDAAGRVISADASSGVESSSATSCLEGVFRGLTFHAPVGGSATLSVPVELAMKPVSLANTPVAAITESASASASAKHDAGKK